MAAPLLTFPLHATQPRDKVLQTPRLTPIGQYMSDNMVNIYIGDERKKFRLHRDLLCERSEFFKASFEGHFKEAETQELALPEDTMESFELLVGWLYGAPLVSIPSEASLPAYLDLVVLAKKLCLEHLQNETMDHILESYRGSLPSVTAHTIRRLYEKTSAKDPLRRLVLGFEAWKAVSEEITVFDQSKYQHFLEVGGEIAIDFTSWLAKFHATSKGDKCALSWADLRRESKCSYHKHHYTPVCSDFEN